MNTINNKKINLTKNESTQREVLVPVNKGYEKYKVTINEHYILITDHQQGSDSFRKEQILPIGFKHDSVTFIFSLKAKLDFTLEDSNKILKFISNETYPYISDLQNELIYFANFIRSDSEIYKKFMVKREKYLNESNEYDSVKISYK